MSAELKPLYANLKRLNFGEYLSSNHFKLFTIENDIDDDYRSYLRSIRSNKTTVNLITRNHEDDEEAFFLLMKKYYANISISFDKFILSTLLDFSKHNSHKIDISNVYENLKELGVEKTKLLEFITAFRKNQESKKVESIQANSNPINQTANPKKVFIVHGHDKVSRLDLVSLLKDEFLLEPIIFTRTTKPIY